MALFRANAIIRSDSSSGINTYRAATRNAARLFARSARTAYKSAMLTDDRRALPLIILLGIALDLACRLIPADLPAIAPFDFNILIYLGCALAPLWYWRGYRATSPADRPALWRPIAFYVGIAMIYIVLQTRFEYAAQHMFFLNRVQQMTIGVFAPFLIAFCWPGEVLARGTPPMMLRLVRHRLVRQPLAVLCNPLIAPLIMLAVTDVWLIPDVDLAAMLDAQLYNIMNLSMIGAGLLFWFVVLDPRPRPQSRHTYLTRMVAGFLPMFPAVLVAATIALSNTNFYSFYNLCGRLYPGISPHYDQLLGGMIQWIPPGLLNSAVLFVLLNALRKQEEKTVNATPIPVGARVIEAKWTGR
jgi:putative membrane protein